MEGFRIQTVVIEGFKGFTTRKEIDLKGCHAFLLGQNGNGKSSIIEAIRWGLFGSTGRPNEIIANRDYSGRCRVDITLMHGKKLFNLRRTLIRGVSGGSDPVLTDEDGKEHLIRDIMPQLDSVDAGEGMHIIFAPQATPLRRQPEDLTPFERTVFNHLGLTHPRALLTQMNSFLDEQELVENNLGEKLTAVRYEIDNQISERTRQRGYILSSPPWGSDQSPSTAESENKARDLIKEITGKQPDESLAGSSLEALIDNAEDALMNRYNQDQVELENEREQIIERRNKLEAFCDVLKEIEEQQTLIQNVQSQLNAVLEDMSLNELQNSVNETREEVDIAALRRRIAEITVELLHRNQTESVSCPVCKNMHHWQDLESALQQTAGQQSEDAISRLDQLEFRLKQAEKLENKAQKLRNELADMEKRANGIRADIDPDDAQELSKQVNIDDLNTIIDRCSEHEASLEAQLDGQEDEFNAIRLRLSKLEEEAKFHQINNELGHLQQSRDRFAAEVEKAYHELVLFRESVRTIQQAVESCLNEQLKRDIPEVSESLSQVFAALTRHPWFDQLTIARDKLPKLELQVASSQDPFRNEHPTGVLNGQAESALELVPYFAFSQADNAPTEVYLVLLDDPTRAFDEEHTKILVERLADLGNHVQLMVASQETARFRELLPENFERSSYVVVEPTRWSYHNGPELEIEYE